MLSKCEIHNVDGSTTFALDSAPVTAGYSALKSFAVEIEDRVITDRNKTQQRGVWPAYSYEGGMGIDITGVLLADTPTHAITQLDLLTKALRGLPATAITSRFHGHILIRRLDKSEDWKQDFTLTAFTAPITADSPVIEYMITLFCFDPWFVGVTSGTKFFWT